MKKGRMFRALTAWALAGVLSIAPAFAAPLHGSPTLHYEPNGSAVDLQIKGLALGHDVYAAQLTIELGGEYPNAALTHDKVVKNQVTVSNGTTQLVVYLDSQSPINDKTQMDLGSLNVDKTSVLPQKIDVIFLDANLDKTEGTIQKPTDGGSSSGGDSSTGSAATVQTNGKGTVKVQPEKARPGEQVTVFTTPDLGYEVASVQVLDRYGNVVAHTAAGADRFSFIQPKSGAVSIHVTFQPKAPHPFTDVKPTDWFYTAVGHVYSEGLMAGISDTAFAPNLITTRGMVVTILHNMEGQPAASGVTFDDVPSDQYYAQPVIWAAANGIVSGYGNGRFGPNDPITREQMASILYRYAVYKGYDTTTQADLSIFTDADQVSSYALEPLAWANAKSLINGVGNQLLDPRGSATRSQVASILMQFCKTVAP